MRVLATACAIVLGVSVAVPVAAGAATPAPPHISGLVAKPGVTSVALTWTNPGSAALHDIMVRRARGTHAPSSPSAGDRVADLIPPAHSVTDTGLVRNATYTYAIFARNRAGGYSGSVTRTVQLAPSQAITGKVTAAAGGKALPDVHVTTLALDTGKAGPGAVSKADGTYRIDGVRADVDYQVCFTAAGVPGGPATGYIKACLGDPQPRIFVLSRGTRRNVNAALSVGGEITGKVTDASSNPLAGVHVWVGPDPADSHDSGVVTKADGTYAVRGLESARYVVCFNPAGATGGVAPHGYAPQCFRDSPFDFGQVYGPTVPVDDGEVTPGVDQALEAHPTISGKVTGAGGAPLAGVRVTLTNTGDFDDVAFAARTGANGTYTLLWDGDESDRMCFTPPPSTHFGRRCFLEILGVESSPGVQTGANQSFAVASGTSTIVGVVTDVAGHPLSGVKVVSQSDQSGGFATTGSTGRYRLVGVDNVSGDTLCFTPGPATLPASATGYLARCVTPVDHDSTQTTTVNAKLRRGVAISGTVTDVSGAPLPGLLVQVVQVGQNDSFATTNSHGRYRLTGLLPGTYTVDFEADGAFAGYQSYSIYHGGPSPTGYQDQCWNAVLPFADPCTQFSLASGHEATGINGRLRRAGGVSGTVTDIVGRPLRHIRVDIVKGGFDDYEFTDAHGNYRGILLPVGTFSVCFSDQFDTSPEPSQGYRFRCYKNASSGGSATPVLVTGGHVTSGINMKLAANPAGTVTGKVTDMHDVGVPGVIVQVGNRIVTSKADGTYRAAGVLPGTVDVCAHPGDVHVPSPSGYLDTCVDGGVSVTAGATVSGADLALPAAAAIAGTVTDANGMPLRDVAVSVLPQGAYESNPVFTDASGHYRMIALVPGNYALDFAPQAITGPGTAGYGLEQQWSGGVFDQADAEYVPTVAEQTAQFDVSLVADGSMTGTVHDDADAAIAGIDVNLQSTDGQTFYGGVTGSNGGYEIDGVRPGSYFVCFAVPEGGIPAAQFGGTSRCYGDNGDGNPAAVGVTNGDQTSGIDGSVNRFGAVQVTVTDVDTGHPLAGAVVSMTDSAGTPFFEFTDATGVAVLVGVVPGSYSMDVNGASAGYPGGAPNGYADVSVMATVAPNVQAGKQVPLAPNP